MLVDNTLFLLILTAITLVIIVLFAVVANLFIESRQIHRFRLEKIAQNVKETPHECAHFFGYLSEHPRNQPIPNECFGCLLAIDCVKALHKTVANSPVR